MRSSHWGFPVAAGSLMCKFHIDVPLCSSGDFNRLTCTPVSISTCVSKSDIELRASVHGLRDVEPEAQAHRHIVDGSERYGQPSSPCASLEEMYSGSYWSPHFLPTRPRDTQGGWARRLSSNPRETSLQI